MEFAPPGTIKFAKKDALPAPEREFSVFDEDSFGRADKRGLDVRIGIAFGMAVIIVARHELVEGDLDVAGHIRVIVLVNDYSRRGVRNVKVANAFAHPGAAQFVRDSPGDVNQLRPAG